MRKMTRLSAASALAIAALALPIASFAQGAAPGTAPAPAAAPAAAAPASPAPAAPAPAAQMEAPMPGAPGPKAGHAMQGMDFAAGVEQHIKTLHSQLHITPAEEPQWQQFAQVMRDNARAMSASLTDRGAKIATMSAVDSMNSYAQLAQQHAENLGKLATAFQTLYASFSDDQKKQADDFFRRSALRHFQGHGAHHGDGSGNG